MRFRPDFRKSRPPEIFGRILNLPIITFQTGFDRISFKSRPRKSQGPFIPACRMQRVFDTLRNKIKTKGFHRIGRLISRPTGKFAFLDMGLWRSTKTNIHQCHHNVLKV
jgi:hypothetical protein